MLTGLRYRFEYAVLLVIATLARFVPWRVVGASGKGIGLAFYAIDRSHRRVTVNNLVAAFPSRSRRECRAVARGVFMHFGRVLMELVRLSTMKPARMMRLVEFEGEDRVRQAYSRGHGVILLTSHFGNWELNGIAHAVRLGPIGVMARALDNPYLNRMLERVRQRTGNNVIYRRGALRRVMRALDANEAVAILIDQHIQDRDAVYVDFFNRPAATTSALAALAMRTGAPVIPVFAIPTAGGRYRMIYEHAVEPPADDSPDAVRDFTQRCTDVLEMYVRRYPSYWLWMHRRWRDNGLAAAGVPGMFPRATRDAEVETDVNGT